MVVYQIPCGSSSESYIKDRPVRKEHKTALLSGDTGVSALVEYALQHHHLIEAIVLDSNRFLHQRMASRARISVSHVVSH